LIDCYKRNDTEEDKNKFMRNILYTLLYREFVNKEKEEELDLSPFFDYTSFNTSEDLILLTNNFLTLCLDSKQTNREDAILFIKEFADWQNKNNFTDLSLTEKEK